ncbi:hypothetical protein M3Y94_00650200 [Aphelenchoides besseyi]|nr:hypothetical protein M3Y94_00650200 [Aphelenchoides besseyi]
MVFVMLSDERLLTRAILLEQFESDVNVKMAMKRVTDELGPKRINKRTAKKWYKRFRKGEMDLTVDPISWFEQVKSLGKVHAEIFAVDDLALLNNGTLLVSNRALVYRFADYDWLCKIHDNEERFLIYYNDDKTFVLDPFHGIKKIVEFDWSSIGSRMVEQIRFYLESLYFLETNKVVGTVHLFKGQTWLFVGTFDLSSCVLKFDKRINLGNLRRNVVFLNSKSILWHRFGSDSTFSPKSRCLAFHSFTQSSCRLRFDFRRYETENSTGSAMTIRSIRGL